MWYGETAKVMRIESVSDGMGGWVDEVPTKVIELGVTRAPVTAETMLKQYGIVSTTAMKLYTEDKMPKGDYHIHYQGGDYRVLQVTEYGVETVILVELM